MAPKRGLGKGLNSLLQADDDQKKSSSSKTKETPKVKTVIKEVEKEVVKEVVKEVPADTKLKITDIEPNKGQPRKNFNEDALSELADSIKKYGVIEPLVVSKKGRSYQIIAGERRWRAARMAGLKEVPVIIREYTDKERMEVALIENLQREDLNPIEEALAYKALIEEYNLKQDEVADRVSKGRPTITNSLRLLKLSDKVQQMIVDDMISSGHARCLLAIEDADVQYETALTIFDEGLSVRDSEKLVKGVNNILNGKEIDKDGKEVTNTKDTAMEAVIAELAENLKTTLGSKVVIKSKGKKGKIEIEYVSSDDLERIVHIIKTGAAI